MNEVQEITPYAMIGHREALHIAMAAIVSQPEWWRIPEPKAVAMGLNATGGSSINPFAIRDEFRACRVARGLSPISPSEAAQ